MVFYLYCVLPVVCGCVFLHCADSAVFAGECAA
jgi:hypothetical protein